MSGRQTGSYSPLLFCLILSLIFLPAVFTSELLALNDFQTESPRLWVRLDPERKAALDEEGLRRTEHAAALIEKYYHDWQRKFGRIRRHLKITLIPTNEQINLMGTRAEGVWSWRAFVNEEGSGTLGIVGEIYVNMASSVISQEALIAHEASHAFLVTYHPKLLESWNDLKVYNEGLAELFALEYEPGPWKNWRKVVLAQRFKQEISASELSSFGIRVLNVLNGNAQLPHDLGFFYLFVVRDGKVDLERDLKECTNAHILEKVRDWLAQNPYAVDLPMIHE
jgi:hypothetical protein